MSNKAINYQPVPFTWIISVIIFTFFGLGIGSPMPWTGAALLSFWLVLYCCGAAFSKISEPIQSVRECLQSIVFFVVTGAGCAVIFWMISAYWFQKLWPGSTALIIFAMVGMIRLLKQKDTHLKSAFRDKIVFGVTVFAILLGMLHYGIVEFQWQEEMLFSGPARRDLFFHTYLASLIREQGLPLVDYTGNPATPFMPPVHHGLILLLAGVENLTGISLFQSSRILALLGYTLITLSALGLVWKTGRSHKIVFIAALSPLLWGGLFLPLDLFAGNLPGVFAPYMFSMMKPAGASGTLYHNLPQIWTLVFTAAGLLALKKFINEQLYRHFSLAVFFIAITFHVKPSAAILTMPALIIFLGIRRENVRYWIIMLTAFAISLSAYYYPLLLDSAFPELPGWRVSFPSKNLLKFIILYSGLIGIGWLYFGKMLRERRWQKKISTGQFDWQDFLLIAGVGGMIFSMFFRETGREYHGNHWWGFLSIICLSAPSFIINFWETIISKNMNKFKANWGRRIAILLLTLHLLGGVSYAISFPFLEIKHVDQKTTAFLNQLRQKTLPEERFLFDPDFESGNQYMTYLARPALWKYHSQPHSVHQFNRWKNAISQNENVLAIIQSRNILVLHKEHIQLQRILKEQCWQQSTFMLNPQYVVWRKGLKTIRQISDANSGQ